MKREIELLRRTISQIEVERSTSAPADATEANTQMNAANHSQCFREIKQLVSWGVKVCACVSANIFFYPVVLETRSGGKGGCDSVAHEPRSQLDRKVQC